MKAILNILKHKIALKRFIKILCAALVLSFVTTAINIKEANACCSCDRATKKRLVKLWYSNGPPRSTAPLIVGRMYTEFFAHRIFMVNIMWEDNILPAMMLLADELSAVVMQQTMSVGMFFDAKYQMESVRKFQTIRAQIHKDFHPSSGMCKIGTNIKSLAASDRKSELTAYVLNRRLQDRQTGKAFTSASSGSDIDMSARMQQFRTTYCDTHGNNNGLEFLCQHNPADRTLLTTEDSGGDNRQRLNNDIDYVDLVEGKWTLDIDFSDDDITNDEADVMALATNLYGQDVFRRFPRQSLNNGVRGTFTNLQEAFMDMRSIMAKRNVAQVSFNEIVGQKSRGTAGSREYLMQVLEDLGIDDMQQRQMLVGDNLDATNLALVQPSYHAQMEVLTKKLYQHPDFYTDLIDKPANVERKGVAIQAIGLMQKFDMFESYLRREASASVLLELEIVKLQKELVNQAGAVSTSGMGMR